MPDAAVFRWSELPVDRPMPLIERRRIIGEKMMVSRVDLARGFVVPTHAHANEQISLIVSGRIRFTIAEGTPGAKTLTLTGGEALLLPSHVPHAAEAIEDTVVFDLFCPPSEKTGVDRG